MSFHLLIVLATFHCPNNLCYELTHAFQKNDVVQLFLVTDEIVRTGVQSQDLERIEQFVIGAIRINENLLFSMINQYICWAFFDQETLRLLCEIIGDKIILSIGSGPAYNEAQLSKLGCHVIATDAKVGNHTFMDVTEMSAVDAVDAFNFDILMSIWPTYITRATHPDYPTRYCEHPGCSSDYCDEISKCYVCNPPNFVYKESPSKPKGYNKWPWKNQDEYLKAQMKRQRLEYEKSLSDPKNLCLCCRFTDFVDEDYAYHALRVFKGDTFIHVGTDIGGYTGSPRLWCELDQKWTLRTSFLHPQLGMTCSTVQVYDRKKKGVKKASV